MNFLLCSCFSTKQRFKSTSFIWFRPEIISLMIEMSFIKFKCFLMNVLTVIFGNWGSAHKYISNFALQRFIFIYFITLFDLMYFLMGPGAILQPLDSCKVGSSLPLLSVLTLRSVLCIPCVCIKIQTFS